MSSPDPALEHPGLLSLWDITSGPSAMPAQTVSWNSPFALCPASTESCVRAGLPQRPPDSSLVQVHLLLFRSEPSVASQHAWPQVHHRAALQGGPVKPGSCLRTPVCAPTRLTGLRPPRPADRPPGSPSAPFRTFELALHRPGLFPENPHCAWRFSLLRPRLFREPLLDRCV